MHANLRPRRTLENPEWLGEQCAYVYLFIPVTLTIDTTRGLTITTGRGLRTDEEFIEARQQLLLHPDFDPCFDRIWNFHAVTESQVTEEIAAQLERVRTFLTKKLYFLLTTEH